MTKKSKTATAPETKKTAKPRKPSPLSQLGGEAASQLNAVKAAASEFVAAVERATGVPNRHLAAERTAMTKRFAAVLKARKVDPTARKKARIEAKLAKLKAELEGLS